MVSEDAYQNREQSGAKHSLLKSYLQTLAYKILNTVPTLAFIDGFSGPWQSQTDDFSDTSFMIAINVLREAQEHFQNLGKPRTIKCFFVEENINAYAQLTEAVTAYDDPENRFYIQTHQGRFEDVACEIAGDLEDSFALTFIDPKGWTGYAFEKILPLLRHMPGEVLITFMSDFIRRAASSNDPKTIESFDPILGGPGWKNRLDPALPTLEAVEKLFREELKKAGSYEYVTSLPLYRPTIERQHYSIVYGTRKPDGLVAFRETQFRTLPEYEKSRSRAKFKKEVDNTGQENLFNPEDFPSPDTLALKLQENKEDAKDYLLSNVLNKNHSIKFWDVLGILLERFMLRQTHVKDICVELAKKGHIQKTWSTRKPERDDLIARE